MPMLAISRFAEKIKNNFIKAIELLRLKFTLTPKNRLWGFAKNLSLRRKKYTLLFSAVLILVAIGLIVPHGPANAGLIDWVGTGLLRFLYVIVYYIFFVLFYLAKLVAWIGAGSLDINLNPAIMNRVLDQSPGSPVYQGWTIFRDIANLFFILILLFIAIGTIVRSQSYNLKNLLPKLIIAVFLINFSNVIASAIIDFGNIFMYGVLKWMNCPGNKECFTDFYGGLMKVVDNLSGKYTFYDGFTASAEATVGIVVATIYVFLYGLILLALGTFLLIRIAAFAILIILSPLLAFTGEVFPGLQELSSKWWKNLINYTLFGPIFALLLYVSGLMAQQVISVPIPSVFSSGDPALGTFGTLYVTIIQNIIPLIFLLAIIPITQELGIAGANAVLGSTVLAGGAFLAGAASFAGGAVDRWMARGAQPGHGTVRKVLSYASPGAWKRALKAHSAEAEHDYDVATGQQREHIIERVTDWPNRKGLKKSAVKHKDDALQRDAKRWQDEVKDKDKNELVYLMQEALDEGMVARAIGIARQLGTTSDMNEIVTRMKDKEGHNYLNTAAGFEKFMEERFEPVLGENETAKLTAVLANLEKKDGNQSFKGIGYFDDKTGEYKMRRLNSDTEAARKEAERMNTTPEAIRKQAEKDAAEERARELGSIESQSGLKNLDSMSLVVPKYERDKQGNVEYWKETDEEVRKGRKKAGEAKIATVNGVEQWEYDYGGIAGLRKMTEAQVLSAWKAKPKHQGRYLSASGADEENQIKRVLKEQGANDAEIDAVIAKVGRLRKKLEETISGTAGDAGGGYDASADAGIWKNITSAGPGGPGAGPSGTP